MRMTLRSWLDLLVLSKPPYEPGMPLSWSQPSHTGRVFFGHWRLRA